MSYTEKTSILPYCYFPPVSWFARACEEGEFLIESRKHYRKQEYTNRTFIRVSNRVLPLSIPVSRRGARMPIRDKRISYQEEWQKQHWRSILFAYTHSPYFDYYRDEIEPLFGRSDTYLVDYLNAGIDTIRTLLGVSFSYKDTEDFLPKESYQNDYRESFHPSRKTFPEWFSPAVYMQVFDGFEPDLSILDLLFNQGPESRVILKNSLKNGH